jgi:hypothetical protein
MTTTWANKRSILFSFHTDLSQTYWQICKQNNFLDDQLFTRSIYHQVRTMIWRKKMALVFLQININNVLIKCLASKKFTQIYTNFFKDDFQKLSNYQKGLLSRLLKNSRRFLPIFCKDDFQKLSNYQNWLLSRLFNLQIQLDMAHNVSVMTTSMGK